MTPAFLIVGGQRCGTNSLYEYLAAHPNVGRARPLSEVHYFDLNYEKGERWYRGHFPTRAKAALAERQTGSVLICGESSPYYMFNPLAPQRIADSLPDAKLIVLLRNPVERAYSHYQHERSQGREPLSFAAAIEQETERLAGEEQRIGGDPGYVGVHHQRHSYLARGLYADQLERLFSIFGTERVLVVISEDLFSAPAGVYERTLSFLDLAPFALATYGQHNAGRYSDLDREFRGRLAEHFARSNDRVEQLLGVRLPWD